MNQKALLLFVVITYAACQLFSQDTYPIHLHHQDTIPTCHAWFVDSSGGDDQAHYGPGEDLWVTFESDDAAKPFLVVEFSFFQLGEGDTLYVYDGGDNQEPLLWSASGQQLLGQTIYSSGQYLHFHFVSSDFDPNEDDLTERLGWKADIGCASLCDMLVVTIDPVDGLLHCPETIGPVSFRGNATYLAEHLDYDPDAFVFNWLIRDETLTGQQISYDDFSEPGAFPVYLTVEDTANDCEQTTYVVVMLGTTPLFTGTASSVDTACARETFSLFGIVHPTTWTGFPVAVDEDPPVHISSGILYESSLDFDVFGDGVEILSQSDFDRICVFVEHVDQSHLRFELEAPDGNVLMLKNFGGATANLGEPVVWNDHIPGRAYAYCFSPEPQYGKMSETTPQFHDYTDTAGNYYFNALYLPEGNYTPFESLNQLAGSTLNGTWTMRVEDQAAETSGHIFGWSLLFDGMFYPDSLIFTPEIVQEQWYKNGSPITGNPASAFIEEPGLHTFRFEVLDNFGCLYDTTVTVTIQPLPRAEIVSEIEIPICEGDSTLLTVIPIDSDGWELIYQWQVGGQDIPGSIYDTLMVKQPGLYSVQVTDTITGCFDFFDKDVTEQNCDLTIPNVFTPNGDGVNDLFEIRNLEHYTNAQMIIYNRHGRRVFEHSDYYNNWWDGGNAPDGVYYYVLRYERMGKVRYAQGSVSIIR